MAGTTSTGMMSWEQGGYHDRLQQGGVQERVDIIQTYCLCLVHPGVLVSQVQGWEWAVTMRPWCPHGKCLGDVIMVWQSLAAGES